MIFLVNHQKDGEIKGEKVWHQNRFFNDQIADFTISKKISGKALIYISQETISQVRGDLAIYTNCFILGQLISAQNQKKYINAYQCNYNEVKSLFPCII